MPIYVYEPTIYSVEEQVNDCCYFEALHAMSEKPLSQCPTCQHAIHRAVTSFFVKENSYDKKRGGQSEEAGASSSASSTAQNAAKLASRHLCGSGCRH